MKIKISKSIKIVLLLFILALVSYASIAESSVMERMVAVQKHIRQEVALLFVFGLGLVILTFPKKQKVAIRSKY